MKVREYTTEDSSEYADILTNQKTFLCLEEDWETGDFLIIKEFDLGEYTTNLCFRKIGKTDFVELYNSRELTIYSICLLTYTELNDTIVKNIEEIKNIPRI